MCCARPMEMLMPRVYSVHCRRVNWDLEWRVGCSGESVVLQALEALGIMPEGAARAWLNAILA